MTRPLRTEFAGSSLSPYLKMKCRKGDPLTRNNIFWESFKNNFKETWRMSMITIVAKSIIKQGKQEDFKVLTEKLIRESRKEKGCISYNLYEDINHSNTLTFIEEWRNEEAIRLNNESTHFTGIVPKFSELREGKTEINLYKLIEEM